MIAVKKGSPNRSQNATYRAGHVRLHGLPPPQHPVGVGAQSGHLLKVLAHGLVLGLVMVQLVPKCRGGRGRFRDIAGNNAPGGGSGGTVGLGRAGEVEEVGKGAKLLLHGLGGE
jgi:hypothetical protein